MNDERGTPAEFDAALYEGAIAEKHHYDNLSWPIGGLALLGAGLLVAAITQVEGPTYLHRLPARVALAALADLLLLVWFRIYQRNRFWVEVANEKLRDLERARGIEGVEFAFMRAALARQVTPQEHRAERRPFCSGGCRTSCVRGCSSSRAASCSPKRSPETARTTSARHGRARQATRSPCLK